MTELERAANDFFPIDEKTMSLDEQSDQLLRQIGFKFGANWQKEQFEKIENYTEEGWNSNSKDEEFIYGISFDEPIKLPVEFYIKKE